MKLDHMVVWSRDTDETAEFWADILGGRLGGVAGYNIRLDFDNGVTVQFADISRLSDAAEIQQRHYAIVVSDADFRTALKLIETRRIRYWADAHRHEEGRSYHYDGGRVFFLLDPNGHLLELNRGRVGGMGRR
ncbi:VOC family protein [Nocardia sp. NPDC051052]|uniref:VOC family protein n=1 Tax=Nocardia sp. NPDC051052 TaxID=3364322 RepID=UPI0037939FF2